MLHSASSRVCNAASSAQVCVYASWETLPSTVDIAVSTRRTKSRGLVASLPLISSQMSPYRAWR